MEDELKKLWWDKKDVQIVTGIRIATLNRWILDKKNIPFIRTAGKIFYDPADVSDFMNKNKIAVT